MFEHGASTTIASNPVARALGLSDPYDPDNDIAPMPRDGEGKERERKKIRFSTRVDSSMGTYEFKFEFEKLSKSTFSAKVSLLDGWVSSPRMTVDEIDRVTVALYHGCIQASEKLAAIQAKIHDQGSSQDDGVPIALVDTGEFSPDGDVSVMPGLVPA